MSLEAGVQSEAVPQGTKSKPSLSAAQSVQMDLGEVQGGKSLREEKSDEGKFQEEGNSEGGKSEEGKL